MKDGSIRRTTLTAIALLITVLAPALSQRSQSQSASDDTTSRDQWEYLVVTSANRINFSSTDNPSLRKETTGAFAREAFVLEQQMDKLGAKGWELVSLGGNPADPIYYFKRRKR
jgi:hypothetical protein